MSAHLVDGPKLFRKASEIAARHWLFEPSNAGSAPRKMRLKFIFKMVEKDPEEPMIIFRPPNEIEIRANYIELVQGSNSKPSLKP